MYKKVVLVGRPNVGKSSFFNRLSKAVQAIVHDTPGVTRDWKEATVHFRALTFNLVDTAGLFDPNEMALTPAIVQQTKQVMQQADIILFMIDMREGVTPYDQELAQMLRETGKKILLIANKAEGHRNVAEAYTLGFGDPYAVSCKSGEGFQRLHETLQELIPAVAQDKGQIESDASLSMGIAPVDQDDECDDSPIKFAIVGRPNAGKSSLINAILKENRLLTGEEAGVTRDAITIPFTWQNQAFELVDTAGLRKKARVQEALEQLSTKDTLESIRYAQVVALLIDPLRPLDKQDLTIAQHILEEGRILIIVVNKKDLIVDRAEFEKELNWKLSHSLAQAKGVPKLYMSALKDKSFHTLFETVLSLYQIWNMRLSTAKLNRWLEETISHHPPPHSGLGRIKIRYMTQLKTRPPSFIFFVNKPQDLPKSYMKYLEGQLRQDFNLQGIPLRLWLRKGDNPYV